MNPPLRLLTLVLVCLLPLGLTSCDTLSTINQPTTIAGTGSITPMPTAKGDKIAQSAEKTTQLAFDVFDAFVHLEYNHGAELKQYFGNNPHLLAERIRRNGRNWLQTARRLTDTYEANRTPENRASMLSAVAVVQQSMSEAQGYLKSPQMAKLKASSS